MIQEISSHSGFQKTSVPEAVVLLLERMELSRGFSNMTPEYSQVSDSDIFDFNEMSDIG
jgi:hypothetical protein